MFNIIKINSRWFWHRGAAAQLQAGGEAHVPEGLREEGHPGEGRVSETRVRPQQHAASPTLSYRLISLCPHPALHLSKYEDDEDSEEDEEEAAKRREVSYV